MRTGASSATTPTSAASPRRRPRCSVRPPRRQAWRSSGPGGSAAAVVAAVARWRGARIAVWSRTPARARALAARAPGIARAAATLAEALDGAALVVNATPLGLAEGDPVPVALDALPGGAAVLDLVYAPGRTRWVRAARAAGHAADDGLAMLVEQGALAFARWFGREPERPAMWRALAGELRSRGADA
jgi:shikimate dehydrogenase